MPLPPTPWLRPPDTDQNYLKGYGLGQQGASEQAQIALAQQRMAQQAAEASAQLQERSQIAQMEIEMRQKEHERQFLMDQQKLEIEKQYNTMQMALGQEKLKEAHDLNQIRIGQDANKAIATLSHQKSMQEIDSDPSTTPEQKQKLKYGKMMEFGLRMSEISGEGTGAAMKAFSDYIMRANAPASATTSDLPGAEGTKVAYLPDGTYHILPPKAKTEDKASLQYRLNNLKRLESGADPDLKGRYLTEAIESEKYRINEEFTRSGERPMFPEVEGLPMPKTDKELVTGKIYKTNRGVGRWDGKKFVKV